MKRSIILGGGCFWCVESVFNDLRGILSVESGYSGGHVENPTYEQVCGKKTGHVEVVRVEYDEDIISLRDIFRIFMYCHDPTTLDRQGNDIGPQYRSIIFYNTQTEKDTALAVIRDFTTEKIYDSPIVTEIAPVKNYFPAEKYHQNYYKLNPQNPYCTFVIGPKMRKLSSLLSQYR